MHLIQKLTVALAILLCGCPTPISEVQDEEPVAEQRAAKREPVRTTPAPALQFSGQPVAVAPQFSPGCTALGDTEEFEGEVLFVDFGKGKDGVIIDDGEVKWVVSYDAEGVFSDFEKERVLARGRQCDKQGEAVKAYHFEVRSLRVIE